MLGSLFVLHYQRMIKPERHFWRDCINHFIVKYFCSLMCITYALLQGDTSELINVSDQQQLNLRVFRREKISFFLPTVEGKQLRFYPATRASTAPTCNDDHNDGSPIPAVSGTQFQFSSQFPEACFFLWVWSFPGRLFSENSLSERGKFPLLPILSSCGWTHNT